MVGNEHVEHIESIATEHGPILVLSPTDSVKDRLAAFFHWNDRQGLDQARMIVAKHSVDKSDILRWAAKETADAAKLSTVRRALEDGSRKSGRKKTPGS
jgi:hypothetical protein